MLLFFILFTVAEALLLVGLWFLHRQVLRWQEQLQDTREQFPEEMDRLTQSLRSGKITLKQVDTALNGLQKKMPMGFKVFLATMRWTQRSMSQTVEAGANIH